MSSSSASAPPVSTRHSRVLPSPLAEPPRASCAEPAVGKDRVLYPGLSEAEETAQRSANGIPYHKEVVGWFRTYGEENGLAACATLGDGSKL